MENGTLSYQDLPKNGQSDLRVLNHEAAVPPYTNTGALAWRHCAGMKQSTKQALFVARERANQERAPEFAENKKNYAAQKEKLPLGKARDLPATLNPS